MVQFRRNRVFGGSYFFTDTLRDLKSTLLIDHVERLREAVRKMREAMPFTIEAWVVLPEHMHAVRILPPNDADYFSRWRSIRSYFTHQLTKQIPVNRNNPVSLWRITSSRVASIFPVLATC
ncbi:MAG: transposase [Nitrosomonas sp.]|nr:transposase [Nitrosomonas sp.]